MRRPSSTPVRALLCGWALLALVAEPRAGAREAPVVAPHVEDWILVRLVHPLERRPDGRTGVAALDVAIAREGIRAIDPALPVSLRTARSPRRLRHHGLDRTYRFHLPRGSDVPGVVRRLSRLTAVEYAEPDYLGHGGAIRVVPDDPLLSDQYGLDQPSDADVDAPEAWASTVGGPSVLAILDTGIDGDHEDLVARLVPGYDFVHDDADPDDDHGHGTQVASVAAADTDNGRGIAGACWGCLLQPLKIYDASNSGPYSVLADGIVWAVDNGARVLNHSGGGLAGSETLLAAVSYAYEAGAVHVSITHNDNRNYSRAPGRYLETIAVGATDALDRRAEPFCWGGGSNYSPALDVVAAGENVRTARRGASNDEYQFVCGTSYAAPLVAGLVGLMRSIDPSLGREEAKHLIRSGADDEVGRIDEDLAGFDVYHGWGRVNMERTLAATLASTRLRVEGRDATRVFLDVPNPLAEAYDFVRGDLHALSENDDGVDLGEVVCLEGASPDADTEGHEDLDTPATGAGFFYLARFRGAAGLGSYGGSSRNRDRRVVSAAPAPPRWSVEGDVPSARLGSSVGSAGDVNGDGFDDVVVGAEQWTDGEDAEGAVFVYHGGSGGPATSPSWSAEGDAIDARLGRSVAGAGDVNGDGFDDLIVGGAERAAVYLGSPGGLEPQPVWQASGAQAGADFGAAVAAAGDVDGDGFDDVLVGAPGHHDFAAQRYAVGRAYLYRGTGSGPSPAAAWTAEGDQGGESLGTSVAGAGDVNGDAFADVIVGAPLYDNVQFDEGRALVYLGSPAGLGATAAAAMESDRAGARLGISVSAAGDVDADGFGDVIAGSWLYTDQVYWEGAAFAFRGSAAGTIPWPAWIHRSGQEDARAGFAVAGAGDVDDDGYDDVLVGSPRFDELRSDRGRAAIFPGSPDGLGSTPLWTLVGTGAGSELGSAVGPAGDVDGDGRDDVIVGARSHDNGEANEGLAVVFVGSELGAAAPAPSSDCP